VEELLAYLARGLVDDPDSIKVDSFKEEDGTTVLELHAPPDEAGRLIGRRGRTISALRTVLKASATRRGERVLIDVVDV